MPGIRQTWRRQGSRTYILGKNKKQKTLKPRVDEEKQAKRNYKSWWDKPKLRPSSQSSPQQKQLKHHAQCSQLRSWGLMGGIEDKKGPHCAWMSILYRGFEAPHWGFFCLLGAFSRGDVTAGRPSLDRHLGVTLLSIQIHEQNGLSLLPGLC